MLRAVLLVLPPFLFLAPSAVMSQQRGAANDATLAVFVQRFMETRPASRVQDLYKALYQEEFGVGHLITSRDGALAYVRSERASLESGPPAEPLMEPCGPDSLQWRVNLRPYFETGGSDTALVDVLIASVRITSGSRALFTRLWERTGRVLRRHGWTALAAEYREFTRRMRSQNWPVVHHSPEYTQAYKPAYRVVAKGLLGRIGQPLPRSGE